jgi:CP12 domain
MSSIQEQIQKAREQARTICSIHGEGSVECAAAWDAIEELQSEAAFQRQPAQTLVHDPLESFIGAVSHGSLARNPEQGLYDS